MYSEILVQFVAAGNQTSLWDVGVCVCGGKLLIYNFCVHYYYYFAEKRVIFKFANCCAVFAANVYWGNI